MSEDQPRVHVNRRLAIAALLIALTFSLWYFPQWLNTPSDNNLENIEVDATILDELDEIIAVNNDDVVQVDSIVVYYKNRIFHEKYFNQSMNNATKVNIHSCGKSVMSALIGIAIADGSIESLDEPVLGYFPDVQVDNWDDRKQLITIRHLLSMTSGLEWDEYVNTPQMTYTLDWVKYVLSRPMAADPGAVFEYNSGGFHVLSAILTKATGLSAEEYADMHLFSLIGVPSSEYRWSKDGQGYNVGGGTLYTTPIAMARFGLLYMNNGSWEGDQVIPSEWFTESTRTQFADTHGPWAYGFGWWIFDDGNSFSALGMHGQMIYVSVDDELVVGFTVSGPPERTQDVHMTLNNYISRYIVPSLPE